MGVAKKLSSSPNPTERDVLATAIAIVCTAATATILRKGIDMSGGNRLRMKLPTAAIPAGSKNARGRTSATRQQRMIKAASKPATARLLSDQPLDADE